AEERQPLGEHEAEVGLRPVPRGGAAGYQPAAPAEGLQAPFPGLLADALDHHVHAALAGEPADLLEAVRRAVSDGRLRPRLAHARHLVVRADRGEDPRAVQTGDLDGRRAHAAAARLDENVLSQPDTRPAD